MKRIAGLATTDAGKVGVVWLEIEPESQVITVSDCCLWEREAFEIIARRLTNTGRYTPVAWSNRAYSDELLSRGVNMLPEAISVDPAVAAAKTTAVWELMRTRQFFAKKGLVDWISEYKTFKANKGKVPIGEHPLMEATWYAVSALPYARSDQPVKTKPLYPKIAMV